MSLKDTKKEWKPRIKAEPIHKAEVEQPRKHRILAIIRFRISLMFLISLQTMFRAEGEGGQRHHHQQEQSPVMEGYSKTLAKGTKRQICMQIMGTSLLLPQVDLVPMQQVAA